MSDPDLIENTTVATTEYTDETDETDQPPEPDELLTETLVEEVSIDGMCGVY